MRNKFIEFIGVSIAALIYIAEQLFVWSLRGAGLTLGVALVLGVFGVKP